jgi:hypothetical protein
LCLTPLIDLSSPFSFSIKIYSDAEKTHRETQTKGAIKQATMERERAGEERLENPIRV